MENEIKVGEYCRTKEGVIDKVIIDYKGKCNNPNCNRKHISCEKNYYNEDEIVKHSPNLIDIIEDEDFCKIEFYSPRYEKRVTRLFEVSRIDEYITFDNMHCDLFMKNGEWGNHDKELNPAIKEIYTKEMMEFISYKVRE